MSDTTNVIPMQDVDGTSMVSSRVVAKEYARRHDNVLRDFDDLDISNEFRLLNFEESNYVNQQGKKHREILMTKDGFMMLCMGFTGTKATRTKERFIECFNLGEKAIRETIPVLQRENESLRLQNRRLEESSVPKTSRKRRRDAGMVDTYMHMPSLFDGEMVQIPFKKPREIATEYDHDMHKIKHCSRIGRSNIKNAARLLIKYHGSQNPLHRAVVAELENADWDSIADKLS
jgi:Rha family phage regulatory protein